MFYEVLNKDNRFFRFSELVLFLGSTYFGVGMGICVVVYFFLIFIVLRTILYNNLRLEVD